MKDGIHILGRGHTHDKARFAIEKREFSCGLACTGNQVGRSRVQTGREEKGILEDLFDEGSEKRAKKAFKVSVYIVILYLGISLGFAVVAPIVAATPTNVVTAGPPVSRPTTASCNVTLLDNQTFAPGVNQPFLGSYAPPLGCQSPWAMIVLDWNGMVPTGQYDRVGGIWIGRSEIFRFTTPETGGQEWHVEKDVSEYAALFARNQTATIIISVPTGKMIASASLTFYVTSLLYPAAPHPDDVISVADSGTTPWFRIGRDAVASQNISLPVNMVRVYLELYATAHLCEETWFSHNLVPNSGCSGPSLKESFREIQVSIDGKLAGVIWPFPYIYTGGLGTDLWESIPPVNALNIPPYLINLTPFIGILGDGKTHDLTIQVINNSGYWLVDGNLLLSLDASDRTTGKLVAYSIAPSASIEVSPLLPIETSANRSITIAGYVNTSIGQVVTKLQQDMKFSDNLVPNILELSLDLSANAVVTTTTTIAAPNGTSLRTGVDSYAVTIREGLPAKSGPVRLLTTYTVDQVSAHTSETNTGAAEVLQTSVDVIHAEHAGLTSEHYVSNESGCFNHYLAALQGSIMSDVYSNVCPM